MSGIPWPDSDIKWAVAIYESWRLSGRSIKGNRINITSQFNDLRDEDTPQRTFDAIAAKYRKHKDVLLGGLKSIGLIRPSDPESVGPGELDKEIDFVPQIENPVVLSHAAESSGDEQPEPSVVLISKINTHLHDMGFDDLLVLYVRLASQDKKE